METAVAWESHPGKLPPEIDRLFPTDVELVFAVPEFKVNLPGGDRASQNDVFALLCDTKGLWPCMVEAKRDEPFGPTLCEWQRKPSQGKTERLDSICSVLGLAAGECAGALRYQLFHRAASAVITATRFGTGRTAMIVQSFSPEGRWFEDYAAFLALFRVEARKDVLQTISLSSGLVFSCGWASAPLRTVEAGQ